MTGSVGPFLRKEVREALRDRRTVMLAFLVPIFVYPVMFSLMSFLDRREAERAEEIVHRVVVTGETERIREALVAVEGLETIPRPGAPGDAAADSLRAEIGAGRVAVWVDVGDTLRVAFDGTDEDSRHGRDAVRDALEARRRAESLARYRAAGGAGPLGSAIGLREVDVASEAAAGGATAGKLIPFLLIMTLFIGGSAMSVDIVAGEKERGTLETLYLTPVSRELIARSKFLVVAVSTVVSGTLNFASMVTCYRMGWIGEAGGIVLSAGGIAIAFALIVPLGALIGGVLLGISAFARSLKEAQYYLLPAMLLAILPGMLTMSQDITLNPVTALIPVANVGFAVRDGLVAPVPAGLLALVAVASLAWAWLTMRWTAGILAREETILGFDPEPLLAPTPGGRMRAALLGMAGTVLVFFYLGQYMQSRAMVPGLLLTLWVLLPLLGAGTMRLAWSGGTPAGVLSLRLPRATTWLGGLLLGLGLVVPVVEGLARLQSLVLPVPEGIAEAFGDLFEGRSRAFLLFFIAVSPGVCEELVFRGAFFGLLRRVVPDRHAVLVSAAFFGLIHLSAHRFVPTFFLGIVFALVVRRTRSIFPAMVAHAAYNGFTVLGGDEGGVLESIGPLTAWGGSMLLLAAAAWLLRREPGGEREA